MSMSSFEANEPQKEPALSEDETDLTRPQENNELSNSPLEVDIEVARQKENHGLSNPNTSNIPNGGWLAWLQVVGAFFLMFNSWGS